MAALREIMTTDVFKTTRQSSVADTAKAMVKGRFGSALIMQGNALLGIFTERDVLRAAASGEDLTSSSRAASTSPMRRARRGVSSNARRPTTGARSCGRGARSSCRADAFSSR